eukprot:INCI14899.1.p2 GENE.INCI14899.1~~INCI14899.1.p2  ORF type:complete len:122 (-),score=29.52 INCI14899.1:219-584(-)
MRLFTHNLLRCNIKNVKNGYPLKIEVVTLEEREEEFNADFIRNIIPKINWPVLVQAAAAFKVELPPSVTPEDLATEALQRKLHHALLEVELTEGFLVCPETGRKFPVTKGIPNMLLHEDEV